MRLRVLIVTFILIPINSLWLMTASLWNAGYPTTVSLFFNTIFFLFLLTFLNQSSRSIFAKPIFSTKDLLAIYIMLTISSAINGLDMLQLIGSVIIGPHALATAENDWQALFMRHIPPWLLVSDKLVLENYIQGESSLYLKPHLTAWLYPALTWSAFTICLVLVMLGLTLALSSRWVSREKLSYPVIQLPLRMVQNNFWNNRLMWVGFIIGASMGFFNGLHFFLPFLPTLGKPVNLGQYLTQPPWNAMGWLPIAVHPFAIGLSFFIPIDISFSCWFFYFFWKLEKVGAAFLGMRNEFPYIDEQTTGAYVGFAITALWASYKYVGQNLAKPHPARSNPLQMNSRHRPESTPQLTRERPVGRLSLAILAIGLIGITTFCLFTGMGLKSILIFFVIYFLISIAIGRIRAELGSPVHDLHFSGPGRMMVAGLGSKRFRPVDLTIISLFWYFNRAYRSHPMPCVLEGFKLGERIEISPFQMSAYILSAVVLGSISGFWAHLHAAYDHGSAGKLWPAYETFNRLTSWLTIPTENIFPYASAFCFGGISAGVLSSFRRNFIWFPLSPVGFVVSSSWAMNPFWFSIFLSWAIKAFILRYGGLGLYRRTTPLFLGLLLGEFVADSGISIAGTVWKVPTYIWYG